MSFSVFMSRSELPSLSSGEQELMDLIWTGQPVAVGELLKSVNESRDHVVSRNTLQTQLGRLVEKGWLEREKGAKGPILYRATIEEDEGRASVLSELKKRLFGGSSISLMSCLVKEESLTDAEFVELERLIRERKKREVK